jgi:hypothetical protein
MRHSTIWCIAFARLVREVILSWVPNRAQARGLFAAALLVTASAAAADILVVRSTGPSAKSYPPGKRIAEGARVALKANDSLDLLDGRGTRTLRGPGNFVAGAAAGRVASNVPVTTRRARIGAVRGVGGGELRPPSIWHVDISQSSTVCVAEPNKVTLWRHDATGPVTLNIARAAGGPPTRVEWEAGASTIAWPAALPIADNSEFRLSWAGGATPTAIRFRTLPQRPVGLEDMASFLMTNQCTAQLDLFIETVRLPDDAPGPG